MFKILYQPSAGEKLDETQLKSAGFDGVVTSLEANCGLPAIGARCDDLKRAISTVKSGKYEFVTCQPTGDWIEIAASINRDLFGCENMLLIEPWNMRRTVRELWQFAEAITTKQCKLLVTSDWGKSFDQVPARVVPTLNHRISAVSVKSDENEIALDYARRLAGIGFGGSFIICNTNDADKIDVAQKLAEAVRHLLAPPAKPKAAVAKAAVVKKPAETK